MFRPPRLACANRRSFFRLLLPAVLLLSVPLSSTSASAQTLLDNTNGGTSTFSSLLFATPSFFTAYGLSVGGNGYDLTGLTVATKANGGETTTITVDLYNADESLKPLGAPIKSFTSPIVTGNDATYKDIDLIGQGFSLAANSRYALGIRTEASFGRWVRGSSPTAPTGPAGIVTSPGVYTTNNSGSTWALASGVHATFWLRGVESSAAAAVPEPGAVILFLPALAAVFILRRRGTASRQDPS